MAGRVIQDYGDDHSWEREVSTMLKHDRTEVFDEGGGGGVGNRIVGSSLDTLKVHAISGMRGAAAY